MFTPVFPDGKQFDLGAAEVARPLATQDHTAASAGFVRRAQDPLAFALTARE